MSDEFSKLRFNAKKEIGIDEIEDNDIGIMTHKPSMLEEGDRKWKFGTLFLWMKRKLSGAFATKEELEPFATKIEKLNDSLVDYDNAKVREFLPSGDLNTITTEGLYSIGHLNNFTNAPRTTDEHGVLRITKSANDMVCQEWIPRNGNMSFRVQISGTTWGNWQELATMDKLTPTSFNKNFTVNSKASLQSGGYFRIGNIVFLQLRLIVNTEIDKTNAIITNLPIPLFSELGTNISVTNNKKLDLTINSSGALASAVEGFSTGILIMTASYICQ